MADPNFSKNFLKPLNPSKKQNIIKEETQSMSSSESFDDNKETNKERSASVSKVKQTLKQNTGKDFKIFKSKKQSIKKSKSKLIGEMIVSPQIASAN